MRRILVVMFLSLTLLMALTGGASADSVYHTHRVPVTAVGDAPLKSGMVVNIHANGTQIYAHEIYKLTGAQPNSDYQVTLQAYPGDTTCSGSPAFSVDTQVVHTNSGGNGSAQQFFTPQDVAGLPRGPYGIVWQFRQGGNVVYSTSCHAVTLD